MYQIHCERPSTGQTWQMMVPGDITISKSKNEPSSLSCSFLRGEMTVDWGDIIAVQLDDGGMDDVNLFYGYVDTPVMSDDEVKITAYDQLYLLKNSTEIKVYGNITASDLYKQIVKEHKLYMVDPPIVSDTGYVIPNVIADNSCPLDMIVDALNITFNATGKRFYIYDFFRNLCLGELESHKILREDYELNYLNIESYEFEKTRSKWVNEVIVKSEDAKLKDDILAVRRAEDEIEQYGAVTLYTTIKDGENPQAVADSLFTARRQIEQTLSVNVVGINPQTYPGKLIYADLFNGMKKEFVKGWFIIESATYTLSGGRGNTQLKLTLYQMETDGFPT